MTFKPLSEIIDQTVRCIRDSQVNGFLTGDFRAKLLPQMDELSWMCEFGFVGLSYPRGLGKTYGIAKLLRDVVPGSLLMAPEKRQIDQVVEQFKRINRDPVVSDKLFHTCPYRNVDSLEHVDWDIKYPAILVDEWTSLLPVEQHKLLIKAHKLALNDPQFFVFGFGNGPHSYMSSEATVKRN